MAAMVRIGAACRASAMAITLAIATAILPSCTRGEKTDNPTVHRTAAIKFSRTTSISGTWRRCRKWRNRCETCWRSSVEQKYLLCFLSGLPTQAIADYSMWSLPASTLCASG